MSAGLSKKRFPCKTLGHFRLSAEHFVRKTSLLTGLDNYLEIFKLNVRSGVVQKNRTKFNALSFCNRSSYNQRSKCSAKITVYQITQKFCQWVKYSLISSRKWTGYMWSVTSPCMQTWHFCSDSRRSTANKDFANWKRPDCWQNDCWDLSGCCLG